MGDGEVVAETDTLFNFVDVGAQPVHRVILTQKRCPIDSIQCRMHLFIRLYHDYYLMTRIFLSLVITMMDFSWTLLVLRHSLTRPTAWSGVMAVRSNPMMTLLD